MHQYWKLIYGIYIYNCHLISDKSYIDMHKKIAPTLRKKNKYKNTIRKNYYYL